jgi:hypothetical protein
LGSACGTARADKTGKVFLLLFPQKKKGISSLVFVVIC